MPSRTPWTSGRSGAPGLPARSRERSPRRREGESGENLRSAAGQQVVLVVLAVVDVLGVVVAPALVARGNFLLLLLHPSHPSLLPCYCCRGGYTRNSVPCKAS